MLIKTHREIPSSEITDPAVFAQRRQLIQSGMALLAGALLPLPAAPSSAATDEEASPANVTPAKYVKSYTNYYEFSYTKEAPTQLAQALQIDPWSVEVSGEVEKPGVYALEDLLRLFPLQERVYRFRCVEAWSMVVPWLGFTLADLLKRVAPTSRGKFVEFTALYQPETMPGQRGRSLTWPYVEGLRIDEAMHPLTLLVAGMYGESLPKQNGAPLRLVMPWKYGFKSIKAIVRIRLLPNAPQTTWHRSAPNEYGFYANVNPEVPHPRWSQRSERVLGANLFTPRRATELFNGYGEQVASLYAGMDLRTFF